MQKAVPDNTLNWRSEGKLRRNLSLLEATVYSISYVIGTGIFLKPATVLINTGSTGVVAALIGITVYIYSKKKYAGQEIHISE